VKKPTRERMQFVRIPFNYQKVRIDRRKLEVFRGGLPNAIRLT
jgi:hypothetical protein